MTGHTSSIHSLSFSAESSLLVSGSSDCTVRVWDVKSAAQEAESVLGGGVSTKDAAAARRGSKVGLGGETLGELPMSTVRSGEDAFGGKVVNDIRCVSTFLPLLLSLSPELTILSLVLSLPVDPFSAHTRPSGLPSSTSSLRPATLSLRAA